MVGVILVRLAREGFFEATFESRPKLNEVLSLIQGNTIPGRRSKYKRPWDTDVLGMLKVIREASVAVM